MEVAVDERLPPDLQPVVQRPRAWGERCASSRCIVEPARHMVGDPSERRRGGTPEAGGDVHRDRGRLLLVDPGEIRPRPGALDEDRPVACVATEQTDGAVTGPQREGVRLLVGLVVLDGRHLEHRVRPGRRDEGVARLR